MLKLRLDLPIAAMDIDHELSAIATEYESFFPECVLVLTTFLASNLDFTPRGRSSPSHIRVTTQEGEKLKVSVTVAGWFVLGSVLGSVLGKYTYFHSFEALMNAKSPKFSQSFANSLTSKLNALAQSL